MADETDPEPAIARWLTVPGRLLLVATILGSAGLFALYFLGTFPGFPAGRYPLFMWVVPVAMIGLVFFRCAAFLLEKLGVRIYRRDRR